MIVGQEGYECKYFQRQIFHRNHEKRLWEYLGGESMNFGMTPFSTHLSYNKTAPNWLY